MSRHFSLHSRIQSSLILGLCIDLSPFFVHLHDASQWGLLSYKCGEVLDFILGYELAMSVGILS